MRNGTRRTHPRAGGCSAEAAVTIATFLSLFALLGAPVRAQAPEPSDTRAGLLAQAQAQKSTELHPYVPTKAEHYIDYAENILTTGLKFHPFFESAYSGGGFTLGAGYLHYVGAVQHRSTCAAASRFARLQADRGGVPRAAALRPARACCRSSAAGAKRPQVGFYGIGTGHVARTIARTTASSSRTGPRRSTSGRRGAAPAARAASKRPQWKQTPGSGTRPVGRDRSTRRTTLPGLGATVTYLHSQATIGVDSRPSRRLRAPRRLLRRHVPRLHAIRTAVTASSRSTTKPSSTSRSCARPGCCRSTRRVRRPCTKSGAADSVLHAAVARRRLVAARLTPAGASAIATACCCRPSGASWSTASSTRRCSTTPARSPRARSDLDLDDLKKDYGLGFRFHGPLATPLRIDFAQEQRRLLTSSSRRRRCSEERTCACAHRIRCRADARC